VTNKLISIVVIWAVVDLCSMLPAAAQSDVEREGSRTVTSDPFLLGPPQKDHPIVVHANFQLQNIIEIDEQAETFAFSGVLTLAWRDERLAFDPAAAGVDEKVYLGAYQFNELATGWFPQVVLVNDAGAYDKYGTMLRVQRRNQTLVRRERGCEDGAHIAALPLDRQRLEIFEGSWLRRQ
jgi:hypothetical protein